MFQLNDDPLPDGNDSRHDGSDEPVGRPGGGTTRHRLRAENDRLVQAFCEFRQRRGIAFRGLLAAAPLRD
ncbi:MAG TPA: hypothetical protein VFG73_08905 [Rhodanobacteraceae bacterium]|nr:hypothetical protein [Rhodanobacteraceae bacterium]